MLYVGVKVLQTLQHYNSRAEGLFLAKVEDMGGYQSQEDGRGRSLEDRGRTDRPSILVSKLIFLMV